MKNVLIVDDDSVFLELLAESLDSYSETFKVITAENGAQAMEILGKEDIALLVTDIVMPDVDGLSLLAHVNDKHYAIPCFVMSAYGSQEIRDQIPKDVLNFFNKPFPAGKLGPAILEAIEQGVPSGVISGISVASFLLLVEMEKKTCLFEIVLPDESKGVCYFNKGVLFNAAYKYIKGEDAVCALLRNEKASFHFKPLPEKKLAQRIDKDISTLIKEAKQQGLEDTQEFVVADREAKSTHKESDTPFHRLDLKGTYRSVDDQVRAGMTVINISLTHLIFRMDTLQMLTKSGLISLEFILDDKQKSIIKKNAYILEVNNEYVRCEFDKPEHYDRLGPYLHFNFLDKQKL